ncbi:MAG: response regulator [Campylobacterota bacterium]|nr:response regulator [Campylobacterota bacterium]
MKTSLNNNQVYYDELIELIIGKTNISSQYLIFQNYNDEFYAINVAKVEELIQNKNIEIIESSDSDNLTLGVSKIRENIVVIVNFDDWLGIDISNHKRFPLIIISKYSDIRIGLCVKNVIGIQTIELNNMFEGTQRDKKISYSAEINVNGEKKLCNIFDFDQLTMDIYPNILTLNKDILKDIEIPKEPLKENKILIAEDSILIQNQIEKLIDKMDIPYQIFNNGALLIKFLENTDINNIGLIITDIEMPVMDGIELLNILYKNKKYNTIPIIAHTNMSTNAISKDVLDLGVLEIVDKLNLNNLKNSILKNMR